MAEKTLNEEKLSRNEIAERLRTLADELEGEGPADVQIGNKTVSLSPSSSIAYEAGIRESASVLRGSRETITVKMDWKPE